MGRWGDGSELPFAMEVLNEFGAKRVLGGLNTWIALRNYPAVLLLYAFGIGALKATRYEVMFRWLTTPVEQENRKKIVPAVQSLFSLAWDMDGTQIQVWRSLEGFGRRKTPLNDDLHSVFQEFIGDYALNKNDFELLFERFEFMASLAHTTTAAKKDDVKRHCAVNDPQSYTWVPFGRSGWHDARSTEIQEQLLAAGFAKGDREFFELALQNLSRAMSRVGW